MATSMIIQRGNVRVRVRSFAPGAVELTVVSMLQFAVTAALLVAPSKWLAGNGTALLTLANHPEYTFTARGVWAIVFFSAGVMCLYAVIRPSVNARKWAWQVVIPLWACWLSGLTYPLIVGLSTNVITLSAVTVLVVQWLVTRLLVPLDSHWYSREVPIEERHQGEGSPGVDFDSCGRRN